MKTRLVHISDIHFREEWPENQEIVLEGFFEDLASQISKKTVDDTFLVISGDLVHAGSKRGQYEIFDERFGREMDKLGITKEKRVMI